jgi:MFS family permease
VKQNPHRDLALINAAGFLRSFGVGLMGVVLGIYLFRHGLSSLAIGFVIAAGLAGSALATVIVSFAADRIGRRRSLLYLSLLSAVGGIGLGNAEWHGHGSFCCLCPRSGCCAGTGSRC